jgi:glucan phosphoethanolaminetransferase (alkaline phosphatase superfamily)
MKGRSISILLILLLTLTAVYYFNRVLQRIIRPRDSAGRMFLYFFANFLLIVVVIVSVVALIVRIFPPGT